jgi:hypothetical protein
MRQENSVIAKSTCILDPMWYSKFRGQQHDGQVDNMKQYLGAAKYIFVNIFSMKYVLIPINQE